MPPVVGLLKLTAVADAPLQTVWLLIVLTVAAGLTVMVKVVVVPSHVRLLFAKCGVTVMLPVIGVLPELVAVNAPILPEPLAPRPIKVLSLDQV